MAGTLPLKRLSRYVLAGFYILAGANHFINPEFYLELIPPYLPYHAEINWLSGLIEMLFGIGLLISGLRKIAVYGIIIMLIAFIPSHVYFIQVGSCTETLCTTPLIGWLRLVIIHPLLIYWAYVHRR